MQCMITGLWRGCFASPGRGGPMASAAARRRCSAGSPGTGMSVTVRSIPVLGNAGSIEDEIVILQCKCKPQSSRTAPPSPPTATSTTPHHLLVRRRLHTIFQLVDKICRLNKRKCLERQRSGNKLTINI